MAELPKTRASLLVRLRNAQDHEAWQEFSKVYAPLLYAYTRRHGLQDADAADVTQETLGAVCGAIARLDYDPQRGSFRSWLLVLAHRKLCDFFTRRHQQCQGTCDSSVGELLNQIAGPEDEEFWNQEYERRQFAWAVEKVRADFTAATWQAFWQTAVEGKPAADVGQMLNMSVGAVYIAKSRVQARLKKEVQEADMQ